MEETLNLILNKHFPSLRFQHSLNNILQACHPQGNAMHSGQCAWDQGALPDDPWVAISGKVHRDEAKAIPHDYDITEDKPVLPACS